jgi:hypothetical protein
LTLLKKLTQAVSENDRHQWKQVHQCVLNTTIFPGKQSPSDLSMLIYSTLVNTIFGTLILEHLFLFYPAQGAITILYILFILGYRLLLSFGYIGLVVLVIYLTCI